MREYHGRLLLRAGLCVADSKVLMFPSSSVFLAGVLDITKLKKTYPIYDEPRLMIAGTVTFFVM